MGRRVSSRVRKSPPPGSLAARFPELVAEWHPTANAPRTPDAVKPGSGARITWVCSKDASHVWEAKISNRTGPNKTGCPFCAGHRVTSSTSLQALFPEVAREWHPTLNASLRPTDVAGKCGKKVWWQCRRDPLHVWQATIAHRTGEGTGCPVCAGKVATRRTSLAAVFPRIAKEWHPTKNGDLRPADVVPGSSRKIWWRCRKDPSHEWKTTPCSRTSRGTRCPFCAGLLVTPSTSLAAVFPAIAREWHPTKNGDLGPDRVMPHSDRRVWWQCPRDGTHVWSTKIDTRTRQGSGCPICSNKRVTEFSSLAARFPALAAEWHPSKNGLLSPSDVVPGSSKRVWWRCPKNPAHEWLAVVLERASLGRTCPLCRTLLAKRPDLAREWHPTKNGSLTPSDVLPSTSKLKVWWRCRKNPAHEWLATPSSRRYGGGCPECERGPARVAPDPPMPPKRARTTRRGASGELVSARARR